MAWNCQVVYVALAVLSGLSWEQALAWVRTHPPTSEGLQFEERAGGEGPGFLDLIQRHAWPPDSKQVDDSLVNQAALPGYFFSDGESRCTPSPTPQFRSRGLLGPPKIGSVGL